MSKQRHEWSEKWESFTVRERVLLLLTVAIAPLVLIFVFLIEPALITLQKVPPKIQSIEASIQSQEKVLALLKDKKVKDPNIAARAELKRLRTQLSEANQEISRAATNLVSPNKMLILLQSVLADQDKISVVSAKSLNVETMQLAPEKEESDAEANAVPETVIFVHPFEVELKGSYQGLYDYLQTIEQLDGVFFWDSLEYVVEEYPTAQIKIKVHTLSSEAGWLGA